MTKCDCCSTPATKRCGKCQKAKYCSVQCQQTDWPTHRLTCKLITPPLLALLPLWTGAKLPRAVHLFKSPVMTTLMWNPGSRFGLDRRDVPRDNPSHICVWCEKVVDLYQFPKATLADRTGKNTSNAGQSAEKEAEGAGVCGSCCAAVYCSKTCQQKNWLSHQHECDKFTALGGVERAKKQYVNSMQTGVTPFELMVMAVANKDATAVTQMISEFAVDGSSTPSPSTCCPFALAVDPEMRSMKVLRPLCSVWGSHSNCVYCQALLFACPVQFTQLEEVMGACRALFRKVLVREAAPDLLYDHVFGLIQQYLGQDAYFLMTT